MREKKTLEQLNTIGVSGEVGGALLCVNDEVTELYTLPAWWTDRSQRILNAL